VSEPTSDYRAAAHGPPPPIDAKADEKGMYSFARYTAQNDHYSGFFQTWTKTILFLLGRQWNLVWNSTKRGWGRDTDIPAWRQQPVTNVTFATYRTLAAKLTKQRPTLEVVPPSGDSNDREAASLGQSILVHLWRALKMPTANRRAIGWYLCTGQVYLRVFWNAEAGRVRPLEQLVEVPHEDPEKAARGETQDRRCPCDADGMPIMRDGDDGAQTHDFDAAPAMAPEGEIGYAVEDPMSVRFDAEAVDAESAREMYVAKLMTKARAKSVFKVDDAYFGSTDDDTRAAYNDLISSAAAGAGWLGGSTWGATGAGSSQAEAIGDRVLVVEYYAKQDDDFPEGRHWISIGQKVVWPAPNDAEYPTGEATLPNGFWPPLVPVLALPIPGQPQAMGVLPQVVPLNEQLNTLDGRIMEYEILMGMGGKWIVHPDDKALRITSDPTQVLASKGYAQGKPPIQAEIQPLPAAVYAERAVLMDKVRTVTALSEAELGTKPEGVSAGRAFLVLQEVTDSVLGPDLQAWEEAYEEIGRRMLVLAQRYYREERSIAIRGERGKWEIRSFSGADLSDGLDVRVQQSSMFPWSKSAQQDVKLNILSTFPGARAEPRRHGERAAPHAVPRHGQHGPAVVRVGRRSRSRRDAARTRRVRGLRPRARTRDAPRARVLAGPSEAPRGARALHEARLRALRAVERAREDRVRRAHARHVRGRLRTAAERGRRAAAGRRWHAGHAAGRRRRDVERCRGRRERGAGQRGRRDDPGREPGPVRG
jgi:hypothetical protein